MVEARGKEGNATERLARRWSKRRRKGTLPREQDGVLHDLKTRPSHDLSFASIAMAVHSAQSPWRRAVEQRMSRKSRYVTSAHEYGPVAVTRSRRCVFETPVAGAAAAAAGGAPSAPATIWYTSVEPLDCIPATVTLPQCAPPPGGSARATAAASHRSASPPPAVGLPDEPSRRRAGCSRGASTAAEVADVRRSKTRSADASVGIAAPSSSCRAALLVTVRQYLW